MRMDGIRRAAVGLSAAVLVGAASMPAEMPAERMYQTAELGPGIYAFICPETKGPVPSGNVTAIVGDDGVLVVDSGRFPTLARRMVAEIRRKTNQPVRYLVHTHWHLDHMVGDGAFRAAFPGATVIATDFTRRKMLEKQVGYLRDVEKNDQEYLTGIEAMLAKGTREDGSPIPEDAKAYFRSMAADIRLEMSELAGARVVEPSLTFDKALTVYLGRREIRIAFLGDGNTAGDTVVYVPDSKVVATGDLLVSPVPYGYGCHPAAWIETLKKLMTLDATAIVPGHGPVMRDWTYARQVIAVLEAVRAQVNEAVREGATLDQTRQRVNLDAYREGFAGDDYGRGRAFRDFFANDAITRAYQEAKGQVAEE
jgi:cyclase